MDILNPAYLAANGLIKPTAPDSGIVYVSIPDPKRDDKYLTIGVPVSALGGSPELTDFLYVSGIDEPNPILMPRISTLNGKSTWGATGDVSLLIYWDGVDSWVFSQDGVDIYSIVDAVESEHPPLVGGWDIIGQSPDIIELATLHVNSDLQTALEDIAQVTTYALGAYVSNNVSYNNTTSGLTAVDVQEAIDEIVTMVPPAPTVTSVTLINSLGSPFDINSIDSSPVLLIPAPPAGKYYDWELKFEFTNGNQQYSFDRSMYLTDGVNNFNYIHHSAINGAVKRIWYVKEPGSDWYNAASQRVEIIGVVPDAAIYLTAVAGFSSPSGNGTLKITSTYTERTFGA